MIRRAVRNAAAAASDASPSSSDATARWLSAAERPLPAASVSRAEVRGFIKAPGLLCRSITPLTSRSRLMTDWTWSVRWFKILTACSADWMTSLSIAEITSGGSHLPGERALGVDVQDQGAAPGFGELEPLASSAFRVASSIPSAKLDAVARAVGATDQVPTDRSPDSAGAAVNCVSVRSRSPTVTVSLMLAAVAPDDDLGGLSDRGHRDHVDQVVEIDDVDPGEAEHDVSGAEAGLGGRRGLVDHVDPGASRPLHAQRDGVFLRRTPGARSTPSAPRVTRPWAISSFMIHRARLIGMLNPTPSLPPPLDAIELLIPITSPFMLTSGPPELPGLIAASVWRKSWFSTSGSSSMCRPRALMIPWLTECVKPNGLPSAMTQVPTAASSLLPRRAAGRSSRSSLSTAMSALASVQTSRAGSTGRRAGTRGSWLARSHRPRDDWSGR